jgi:hypothetical protein
MLTRQQRRGEGDDHHNRRGDDGEHEYPGHGL